MARLQFKPATQSKGFAPIQLSKASLSEMEKRDNELLKALESKHAAEMKQRETNLQAMRENDAYTQRRFQENRQIEVDNLQREQSSLNQIAARDDQQAKYNQQAAETILNSIADFSKTAAQTAAKNTAKQLVDQTRAAQAVDLDELRSLDHKKGINLAERTGILNSSKIEQEDAQAGVPPHQTKKNFLAENGLGLVGKEKLYNRLYEADYEILLNKNLQDTEEKFQLPNGRKFSGADVENSIDSPEMFRIVARATGITVSDLMRTNYGITERHFFTDARGNIQKQNEVRLSQYSTKSIDLSNARLIDIGDELIYSAPDTAYKRYTQAGGHSLATKKVKKAIRNEPDPEKRERLGAIIVLDQKGKRTTWKGRNPNTFAELSVEAEAAETKRLGEEKRARLARLDQHVFENQDDISLAYSKDPAAAAVASRELMIKHGNGTLHPLIVAIESAQLKESTSELERKISNGSLSLSYVNRLPISLRKQGMTAFKAMREKKYGTDDKDIIDGMISSARDLTGIIGDGPNSVQTLQARTSIHSTYIDYVASGMQPKEAWLATKEEIAKGKADPESKFYVEVKDGGVILPNIQKPSKDKTERLNYVQKKILEVGTDTVNQAFVLDDSKGMDETYRSSTIPGQTTKYGIGIMEFADKFGFTYAEVFNAHRKANNAATGENKPLIGQSALDEVRDPNIQRLIFNGYNNKTQSLRGAKTADGIVGQDQTNFRTSFRGNSGTFDDMFTSIGLNEGTRTSDGGFTSAYSGHIDPGDGAYNRGTISAREGTPEEADQNWQNILKNTQNQYSNVLASQGIPTNSDAYKVLMFNILDLRVQAPATLNDFVDKIPNIIKNGISAESIGKARADSFYNPNTGNLDTTFNSYEDLLKDQKSRSMTVLTRQRG